MKTLNLDIDQLEQGFLVLSSYILVPQALHLLFRQRLNCVYSKHIQSEAFGLDEYIKCIFMTSDGNLNALRTCQRIRIKGTRR